MQNTENFCGGGREETNINFVFKKNYSRILVENKSCVNTRVTHTYILELESYGVKNTYGTLLSCRGKVMAIKRCTPESGNTARAVDKMPFSGDSWKNYFRYM